MDPSSWRVYKITPKGKSSILISGAPVTFEVPARAVRPPFGSDAELHRALSRSATAIIRGEAA